MSRYTKQELLEKAIEFQKTNGRPPKLKELPLWRTILRHWEKTGAWTGYLHEAGMKTYEEYEFEERVKAIKAVLQEYGEIPQKEYNKIVESGKYTFLPDVYTLNRMFGTVELGNNGKLWNLMKII